MATITKAAKESAPKTEKKSVAADASKSAKSTVKAKSQPSTVTQEPKKAAAPIQVEKAVKKSSPPVEVAVEEVAPRVQSAVVDKKWQEIKSTLEKLKEDTLREIRKSVKKGTEAVAAIEPGGDIYDQASSERDRELGLLLGDREREKIHSIDEALLRINEGDYGICDECDEDIPLGRLKAMPFTRHCVKCKSDLEKLQAQTKRVEEERAYREIPLGAEDEES